MADPRIIAEGLRFPEGPVAMEDGSVLVTEIARGTLSRVTPDGGVEVVADLGGGPNGAAVGADRAVYVCNNGGCFTWHERFGMLVPGAPPPDYPGHGSIQRVDLATGDIDVLYTECDGHPLRAPNDLVIDAAGGLWFTDHGVREGRTSDRTGVYYALPDGSSVEEVIFPCDAPNGIGLSPGGDRLYVAETYTGRLWAWDVPEPGRAEGSDPLGPGGGSLLAAPGGHTLFDSLAVDGEGWICVGTVVNGGITAVSPDGATVEHTPLPDVLVTNICFALEGPAAYVTLSGTGRLAALDWPRPGGVVNFTA